ncbi:MAG: hypothetical protein M1817_000572 [Caeruleum heppii]|nr:MAG: hypothetical protein M1817_000572 [Caeruleum heppii]
MTFTQPRHLSTPYLIHAPLHLYGHFLQPVLQLLFLSDDQTQQKGNGQQGFSDWAARHPFLNVSVTPVECSVVCSRQYVDDIFEPILNALGSRRSEISITTEDYVVIQVDGEGLDAGQRVLELTTPLALAGISIFFITTYFSDYILVPAKSRGQVVSALKRRGFVFEKETDAFINQSHHHRNTSSMSSIDTPSPSSPLPGDLDKLQLRTFASLKRQNVTPQVDTTIRLIQCAARKEPSTEGRNANEAKLHLGLIKCLISQPRFLSLTLADKESPSLLVEKSLLPHFGPDDVLLGSKLDILIPITLDLRDLPLESTGIVCGVAEKLVNATSDQATGSSVPVEMSYLSTARAGTVMVAEEELQRTLDALQNGGTARSPKES